MSIQGPTHPVGRLTRVYNAQERAAIDPFKTEYLAATTPAARKTIAQVHILPALFNYWRSIGQVFNDNEMRGRAVDLLKWLRNVWRSKSKPTAAQGTTPRLTDVLWWTRKDAIMQEIASRMDVDYVDTSTPGWLGHRLPASIQILNAMSAEEKDALRDEADRFSKEGLPVDIQRKHAEEKWYSRFTREAKEHYASMGLLSVSVVAYADKAGRFIIDVFDEIPGILGLHSGSFEDLYEDLANEMKRALLEYIKTIRNPTTATGSGTNDPTISVDPDGFPMLPESSQWTKSSKDDLEKLYRSYMTMHYRLACRDRDRQTPFKSIASRPADFVDPKYLPKGLLLNDPRSMKLKTMIEFFQHVESRQASHGVQDAFRFKSVMSRRNKGELDASRYPRHNSDSDETSSPGPGPDPVPRKRKRKAKAREKEIVPDTNNQQELMQAQYAFHTLDGPMTVTQTAQAAIDNASSDYNRPLPAASNAFPLTEEQKEQVFYDSGLLSLGLIHPPVPSAPLPVPNPQMAPAPGPVIDPYLLRLSAPVQPSNSPYPPELGFYSSASLPVLMPQTTPAPVPVIDPMLMQLSGPVQPSRSPHLSGLNLDSPGPMVTSPVFIDPTLRPNPQIASGSGTLLGSELLQQSAPLPSPTSLHPIIPKGKPRPRPIQKSDHRKSDHSSTLATVAGASGSTSQSSSSQRPVPVPPVPNIETQLAVPASAKKPHSKQMAPQAGEGLVVTRSGRTVKPNTRLGQL